MLGAGNISRLKILVTATDQASAKINGITEKLGALSGLAAGAAVGGIAMFSKSAVDSFLSFDKQMADSLAMFSGLTDEMKNKMRDTAREIGRSMPFVSANEAAEGLWYLGSAGLSAADSLKIVGEIAKFSMVNVVDMGQGADIAATLMKTFNKTADEVPYILDMITSAQKNALTTMGELGEAFTYTAGQAAAMGIPIQDLLTSLDMLADAGIKGSQAGTALRRIMVNITAPTGRAKNAIEELGLSFFDAEGNFIGLDKSLFQIMETLGALNEEQRLNYLEALAGTRAISGLATIVSKGQAAYDDLNASITDSNGLLDEMAEEKINTAAGQWDMLMSKVDDFKLTVGGTVMGVIEDLENLVSFMKGDGKTEWEDALSSWQNILLNAFYLPPIDLGKLFKFEPSGVFDVVKSVTEFARHAVNFVIDQTVNPVIDIANAMLRITGVQFDRVPKIPALDLDKHINMQPTPPTAEESKTILMNIQNMTVNDWHTFMNDVSAHGVVG
jgi:TP901 family phage tail tape measure protein